MNGYVLMHFPLQQRMRQGCPLSPLLYVLYAEVLAESIANPLILSVCPYMTQSAKVSQYADNTTLFLHEVVNLSKCFGLWLGGKRFCPDSPLSYTWSSTRIKILRLYFGPAGAGDSNFEIAANKYYKTFHLWSTWNLSMTGKQS